MQSVANKKILLVIPYFHGYEIVIAEEMEKQGMLVKLIIFESLPKNVDRKTQIANYTNKITDTICNSIFDYLLVINLDFIGKEILDLFKQKNPEASTIFYLWDSLINLPQIKNADILSHYHLRFSFDFSDCVNYPELQLRHRPTFYHPYGASLATPKKCEFDIASVMSAMPMRLTLLNKIDKLYRKKLKLSFHVHFPSLVTIPAYIINHQVMVKLKFVERKKITIFQTLNMVNKANCLLDIPYFNQNGLTLRSLDAIGMNKKLITTNQEIVRYKFYSPANILVMPPAKPEDIGKFLEIPMEPIPNEIVQQYSITNWVQSILLHEEMGYVH